MSDVDKHSDALPEGQSVLSMRDLRVSFKTAAGLVRAVRGVSLEVPRGKTVAIVGESGSGKSITVKQIMGIHAHGEVHESGQALFSYEDEKDGPTTVDVLKLSSKELSRRLLGRHLAMVFQDPMTSLDPTMTIGRQLEEGMIQHQRIARDEARRRSVELLDRVGITEPEARLKAYPHQLSGGMRQRVVIAIALSNNPDLLVCDEPTTALDVTIQARILQLIRDLQSDLGISVIFITHNFGVVAKVADYVNVMYAGKIVESGTTQDVFFDPRHPYTWGLLSSMPTVEHDRDERLFSIKGNPPNMLNEIVGDAFAPRNPYALDIDFVKEPPAFKVNDHHWAATWLLDPRAPKVEMPEQLRRRIERMRQEGVVSGGR